MHSNGFEKCHILCFAYLMKQFSKNFHQQRTFYQLFEIIVVNNLSNVKKTYLLMLKLRYTLFAPLDHYSWLQGSVKIFSVKGGCQNLEIQGGWDPRPSYAMITKLRAACEARVESSQNLFCQEFTNVAENMANTEGKSYHSTKSKLLDIIVSTNTHNALSCRSQSWM